MKNLTASFARSQQQFLCQRTDRSTSTNKSIRECKSSALDICQTVCLYKLAYVHDRLFIFNIFPPLRSGAEK